MRPSVLRLILFTGLTIACDSNATSPADTIHFTSISVGHEHVCALDDQRRAWCWGSNFNGESGIVDSLCPTACGARPVKTDVRFTAISAGYEFTCAVAEDGTVYCWGGDISDVLGRPTRPGPCRQGSPSVCSATPVAIAGDSKFSQVAAGLQVACAVTRDGVGKCWGDGITVNPLAVGQKILSYVTPFTVTLAATGDSIWSSFGASAEYHTCGVTRQQQVACWGENYYGEAGVGSVGSKLVSPTPVAAPGSLHGVVNGINFSCALDATGNAYCWGYIANAALGFGPLPPGSTPCFFSSSPSPCYPTPTKVVGGLTFTMLAAGDTHVCGLLASGEVYCWGQSRSGAAGVNSLAPSYLFQPTQVGGGQRFASIAAGGRNTCGVTADGQAWCWGEAIQGEVGNVGQLFTGFYLPVRVLPRQLP